MLRLRTLAPAAWICAAALWLVIAGHRSAAPVVLGCWSRSMALLVGASAMMLVVGGAIVSAYLVRRERWEPTLLRWLTGIRRRRWLSIPLAVAPLAAWLFALAYLANVELPFMARAWCGFALFTLIIVLWLALLLFSEEPPSRQRRLAAKVALAGFSTLLAIVAIEVAGRAMLGEPPSPNLNPPRLDVEFVTGEFATRVVTNRQGLREFESIDAKPPDERRVAFIGDSVTFGWGVESERTFAKLAEVHWRVRGQIRTINAGKPGAALPDYLRMLRDDAVSWDADWIVLGFLVGNDCPVVSPVSLADDREVQESLDRYCQRSPSRWLQRSLVLGSLHRGTQAALGALARRGGDAGLRGPLFGEPNPLDEEALTAQFSSPDDKRALAERFASLDRAGWIVRGQHWDVNPWLIRSALLEPTGAASALGAEAATRDQLQFEWRLCEGLLDALNDAVAAQGARLCILAIPSPYQVSPDCRQFLRDLGCQAPESLVGARRVNLWLAEYCAGREILLVDPLDAFLESDDPAALYYAWDGHPTPAGHRLLAERLVEQLPSIGRNDENQ